jgi:ribosomal protein S6--L-glutamate ligase
MKIAILTRGSAGAVELAKVATQLGHTTVLGIFDTPEAQSELLVSDVFIPRISHMTYNYAVQTANTYATQNPHGVIAVTPKGIERSFDKFAAYQDMTANLVPTPATYLLRTESDASALEHHLPLIIKPRTENQGHGIAVVNTMTELLAHVRKLIPVYGSCIAQEFISESAGRDIRAFVVGHEVVAAMERQSTTGSYLANLAAGGRAEPIELTAAEQVIAVKAARLFGAEYAGVDLLRSSHGPVVIEVNVSPGLKIATITNTDIPMLIIQYLTQQRSYHD